MGLTARRAAGLRASGLAVALLLGGCATALVPPAEPSRPRPAFLLDHGRHATLVLVRPGGGLVRYSYGDWAYYGRNRTGAGRGLAALLWRTPAALGRRELSGPATATGVRRAVRVVIEDLHALEVAGERSEGLQRRLDARFAEHSRTRRFNRWYDLAFVRLPDSYSLAHNSNTRVGVWLEELGVAVRGRPFWSSWRVERP